MNERGYFGIGIFHCKTAENIGTLWRSANILGADFIFTIGRRYQKQASDTARTTKHIPLFHFKDYDDFFAHVPYNCQVVAIEITESAIPLEAYTHPERCVYLLGAEDYGLPNDVLNRCQNVVRLLGKQCMNVATAGSIVMYDRATKRTR